MIGLTFSDIPDPDVPALVCFPCDYPKVSDVVGVRERQFDCPAEDRRVVALSVP